MTHLPYEDKFPKPISYKDFNRYKKFIIDRINREFPKNGCFEKHHIVPRSFWFEGISLKDNLIKLSRREHYIAHLILWHAFSKKMAMAFYNYFQFHGRALTSKQYKRLKEEYIDYSNEVAKGSVWLKKGEKSVKAYSKEELDYYLSKGYFFGRYIDWEIKGLCGKENGMYGKSHTKEVCNKISKDISKRNTNRKWIHKGSQEKFVEDKEIGYYLTEGWIYGRVKIKEDGSKFKCSTKGKISINNGEINKMIFPEEEKEFIEKGWKRGQIIRNLSKNLNSSKNKKWINNGFERKTVHVEEMENYIKSGWKMGMKF